MKLFDKNGVIIEETKRYLIEYERAGSTLRNIRQLIASLFNTRIFEPVDLFGLMRGADSEHAELIVNIIEICSLKYGNACFDMIEGLTPEMLEKQGDEIKRKENPGGW